MRPVRIGVCSWADKGLLERWYPRGVSSAAARLGYYAARFDVVEVDSPFYRLPAPEVAAKWAERTPPGFTFHAKASGEMTGHREREAPLEEEFRRFREALGPLEEAGKLRGVLMQYPSSFKKADESLEELRLIRPLLEPLVPLVEFRHRSWMTPEERHDTLAFLEAEGLAYVSVDAPRTRATNVMPRVPAATREVAYIRFHGRNWKTWNIRGAKYSASASTGCTRPRSFGSGSTRSAASPRTVSRSTPCSTTTGTTTRPGARRSCGGSSTRRASRRPAASTRARPLLTQAAGEVRVAGRAAHELPRARLRDPPRLDQNDIGRRDAELPSERAGDLGPGLRGDAAAPLGDDHHALRRLVREPEGDHRAPADAFHARRQLLELVRLHVSAADDDHVLLPAADDELAACEVAEVAGSQPAVAKEV